MLHYLLFAVYLVLLSWLLLRVPFIRDSGINRQVILGLFFIKVAAGIAIGWISLHWYGSGNDYWDLNRESWNEYQLMIHHPGEYFSNLFSSGYEGGYDGIFSSYDSYWNDLRGNVVIKLLSVFNIFSRGDYYVNSLFFNFLVFFAHVTLYRLFIQLYPGKNTLVILGSFVLPSALYFSSGIHKDGLMFLLLSVVIYTIFQGLRKNAFTAKRLSLILAGMFALFIVRNYTCLVLVPAALAWIIAVRTKKNTLLIFGVVYLSAGLLLSGLSVVTGGRMNPLKVIVQKQSDYLNLGSSETSIPLQKLQPNLASFTLNAPQAIDHSLLRPYIWELPTKSILPFNLELLLYEILFLVFIFFRSQAAPGLKHPYILFTIFFCLGGFLLIGYIVPALGAIIRYRGIYFPFLITPLLCSIDWQILKVKK